MQGTQREREPERERERERERRERDNRSRALQSQTQQVTSHSTPTRHLEEEAGAALEGADAGDGHGVHLEGKPGVSNTKPGVSDTKPGVSNT